MSSETEYFVTFRFWRSVRTERCFKLHVSLHSKTRVICGLNIVPSQLTREARNEANFCVDADCCMSGKHAGWLYCCACGRLLSPLLERRQSGGAEAEAICAIGDASRKFRSSHSVGGGGTCAAPGRTGTMSNSESSGARCPGFSRIQEHQAPAVNAYESLCFTKQGEKTRSAGALQHACAPDAFQSTTLQVST